MEDKKQRERRKEKMRERRVRAVLGSLSYCVFALLCETTLFDKEVFAA